MLSGLASVTRGFCFFGMKLLMLRAVNFQGSLSFESHPYEILDGFSPFHICSCNFRE